MTEMSDIDIKANISKDELDYLTKAEYETELYKKIKFFAIGGIVLMIVVFSIM
jgi:hypothetical protein